MRIIACVVGARRASRARKQQRASNALRRAVSRTLLEKGVYPIVIGLKRVHECGFANLLTGVTNTNTANN